MNKKHNTILLSILLYSCNLMADDNNLATEKNRLSYAMGVFLAESIKQQNKDLNADMFVKGIKDSLKNNQLDLDPETIQQILTTQQQKEQEAQQQKAQSNLKRGNAYMEENKKNQETVELENGIQYQVIKEGSGQKPSINDKVTVHYRGTLTDGTEFDSSYSRNQPATFGVNQVIKGWQEILQIMPVDSKWRVVIPPELAYGSRGAGNKIGPNETLVFEIELLGIN